MRVAHRVATPGALVLALACGSGVGGDAPAVVAQQLSGDQNGRGSSGGRHGGLEIAVA